MDLSKEWYRSEFVNQEMLEQHRVIETEYTFYDAIANGNIEYVQDNCKNQTFTNPDGMGKLSEDKLQNIRYHFVVTTAMSQDTVCMPEWNRNRHTVSVTFIF